MKARKRKKRRSSRTNNTPAPAVGAGVKTARRAATARRKLAKRALYVGQVLLLLLTADWVLQEPGIEAHRVVAVSAYVLQGVAALLLAAEALPGAVAVFTPVDKAKLITGKNACVDEVDTGACSTFEGTAPAADQGSGTNGPWNDWDTSLVTDMKDGERPLSVIYHGAYVARPSSFYLARMFSLRLVLAVCTPSPRSPACLPLLVLLSLSSSPLTLWSPPPPPPPSVLLCLRLQPGPVLVERRPGHDHGQQ